MITSTWLLAPWAMLWVVLLRALLVRAGLVAERCRRCGLPVDGPDPAGERCSCRGL